MVKYRWIKVFFWGMLLLVVLGFPLGCAVGVGYAHDPSRAFFRDHDLDFDDDLLRPYRDNGILFIAGTRSLNREDDGIYERDEIYKIHLLLYAKESGRSVTFKSASLTVGDERIEVFLDTEVQLDEPSNRAGVPYPNAPYLSSIIFFEVEEEFINETPVQSEAVNGEFVYLEVHYEIDGRCGVMKYNIRRIVWWASAIT